MTEEMMERVQTSAIIAVFELSKARAELAEIEALYNSIRVKKIWGGDCGVDGLLLLACLVSNISSW